MVLTILRNGGASVALTLICVLLLQRKHRVPWAHAVLVCVFSFAMSAVFVITGLTPMSGGLRTAIHIDDINFIPFLSIYGILQSSVASGEPMFAVTNILGNIALFIPLGFLLPLLWKRYRKLWKTLLFGLAVTLSIEIIQLFLTRGTDLDDVILNILGTLAGYGIFRIFRRRAKRLAVHCTLPKAQRRTLWRFFPYFCVVVPLIVSFLLGYVDRNVYLQPADAAESAVQASDVGMIPGSTEQIGSAAQVGASGSASQSGEAPQPAPGGAAVINDLGLLVFNDHTNMTITALRANPEKTVTPSEEDIPMLTGLFFGRPLSSAVPAVDGDIVIETSDCKLIVDTLSGAVIAATAEQNGASTLPEEDVAVLCEILARYDLPTNRANAQ